MASKTDQNEKHNLDLYYQEAVNIAKIAGKVCSLLCTLAHG